MIIDENNKIASEKLLNKSTKLTDAEKSEYFKKFYELDFTSKRYPDNPKHLITLIKWFLEDPVERQYELIKVEYETYLEQARRNQWRGTDVVIKDIAKFPNFRAFAEEVHRIDAKSRKSHSKGESSDITVSGGKVEVMGKTIDKKDTTLVTDDVVVARADTMQKSIAYGSGFSSWCTARSSGNYFYEYRFGSYGGVGESTLYYVYFPKRYSENPNNDDTVLHFGVNDDGQISFTNRSNSERIETLSWLKTEYPEFKDVSDMYEIFPHKEITSSERKVSELPNNMSDADFYALSDDDTLMYLQSSSDRVINLNKFKRMSDEMKSNYLGIVENSGLLLDTAILDIIKNTSMGRRYFKKIPVDIVDDILKRYDSRNPSNLIEIIHLIIDNKKDDIDLRTVNIVLQYAFNRPIDSNALLNIGKRLGESNLNKLRHNNVKELLLPGYLVPFETRVKVLGDVNIDKLNYSNNLSDLVTSYAEYDKDTMIRFVLQRFNNVTDIRLVDAILSGLSDIQAADKLDIQSVIFQLIDTRKKLGKPFDGNFITSCIRYSPNVTEVMARIGGSYDVNTIDSANLLKLLNVMNDKNSLREFEQHFATALLTLTKESIDTFLDRVRHEDASSSVPKINLLLKYTINKWTPDQITALVRLIAGNEVIDEKRDLLIQSYLKMFGMGRWNEFTETQLVEILSKFNNVVSAIEQVFGKNFILSKLHARDFARVYASSSRAGSDMTEKNGKLLEFIVKNYELTSTDILTHLRYFPINKFESIVGSENVNKLTPDDVFILLNNNYLDSVLLENYITRYIDKVLQLSPEQISRLLTITIYSALRLFDILLEKNYNFTNEQIVQFLLKISKAISNGSINGDSISVVLEKLGKNRIQRLDNDALVKLGSNHCYKFEKLLDYVSIDSLNGDAIRTFLQAAYDKSNFYMFKIVFAKLKTVVNKLTSEDIAYLMELGGDLVEFLFNYVNTENPSLFTSEFVMLMLKKASDGKIYKYASDQLFKIIGEKNVNRALNTLDEIQLNKLLHGDSGDSYGNYDRSFVISLIKVMSKSNLSKISDMSFEEILQNLPGATAKDDMTRQLLSKPNLNSKNMYGLLMYAPLSFLKYELKNYKKVIDQLNAFQITELFLTTYSLDRMKLLVELIDNNLNKLDENQIYNILTMPIYGRNKQVGRKFLVQFKKVLNKLSPEMMEKLKQSQHFAPSDVDAISFMGTGKFTPSFQKAIKDGNYTFLNDFTDLCFNTVDNIQTPINYYLRVLGEYIRSHNNTLNYTEFEVIMRKLELEKTPDVINAVLQFLSKVLKTKLYTYLNTYNKGRKYNDKVIKEYKRYYLDLLFEDSSFSQENLDKALDIERKAYPPHMQLINSYIEEGGTLDIYDVADYLECGISDIVFHMGSNWFILGCNKGNELEIADWASDGGMSPGAVKTFFSVLSQYKGKTITCSARETTSYKLIKNAEKLGYVTVLEEEEWSWGGVKMVDLKFRFSDKFMNRINKGKKTDEVP